MFPLCNMFELCSNLSAVGKKIADDIIKSKVGITLNHYCNMPNNKKGLLIFIIIIAVIALGAAGYYFIAKKAPEPVTKPIVKPVTNPGVWDGTYKMTGNLACKSNIPDLSALPIDSTLTVSNDNIIEPAVNKVFAIDKNGKAAEAFQQTANGETTDVKANYQFYEEGGINKFTADSAVALSATKDGQALSANCTGTITGAKQ